MDNQELPLHVVPMPSDSLCLFHVIDYFVHRHNSSDSSFYKRRKVVDYILANWEILKVWTHNVTDDNFSCPDHYCCEMMKPSMYGSSCKLIAASDIFNCVGYFNYAGTG